VRPEVISLFRKAWPPGSGKLWPARGLAVNSAASYLLAVACVAVAALARVALGTWITGDVTPFETYYPAVLVAALIGGAASGIIAIALAALCAWWSVAPPYDAAEIYTPSGVFGTLLFVFTSALIVWTTVGYRKGHLALLAEQEKRLLLMRELQHRLRNISAVIQAIVTQSLRGDGEQAQKINGRIATLIASSELLGSDTPAIGLKGVLTTALAPYDVTRVDMQGDDVALAPETARALALTVHELATNAAKYGSLSVPRGKLSLSWRIEPGRLEMHWRERDGPSVQQPSRRGFGTEFIGRLLRSVGGNIETDFQPKGLACTLSVALAEPSVARDSPVR
jgi:two-component sensor histidine kinase